jgi:hypothetical protein
MIKRKDIKKFQEIYRKTYGEDISYEEAFDQGLNLLNLMKILI